MKDNLNTFSMRAQKLIATPEYYLKGFHQEFIVTTDKNDRILTVLHGEFSIELEVVFAEVLSKFGMNKKIPEIWSIHFREIESFLRDENHLPAFSQEQEKLEIVLQTLKILLVVSAVKSSLGPMLDSLFLLQEKWDTLNLAAKNAFFTEVLKPLGLELILYADDILTIAGAGPQVQNSDLESVLQGIFQGRGKVLPMKVVAV